MTVEARVRRARELDHDRADATGAADDEQRAWVDAPCRELRRADRTTVPRR